MAPPHANVALRRAKTITKSQSVVRREWST